MKITNYNSIKFTLIAILLVGFYNLKAQAPSISSFSPTSGSIGTLVTITGTNLSNIDTIKIGGVAAIKISSKTDTLVAMVMPGAATGSIYIANANGNAASGTNFIKTNSIPPTTQQGNKLVGTGGVGGSQGLSVSLSSDGNTALVGASNDNNFAGATWVYTRNGTKWSQQGGKLVGSGAIGNSSQGLSVSLNADGNTAIIGGSNDSNGMGATWIFTRIGDSWSQQGGKLVGTGSIGMSHQGRSVDISADGNTALIGGNDSNGIATAWIFTRSGNLWSQQGSKLVITGASINNNKDVSVSLSADGNTAILGCPFDNSSVGAAWYLIALAVSGVSKGISY